MVSLRRPHERLHVGSAVGRDAGQTALLRVDVGRFCSGYFVANAEVVDVTSSAWFGSLVELCLVAIL